MEKKLEDEVYLCGLPMETTPFIAVQVPLRGGTRDKNLFHESEEEVFVAKHEDSLFTAPLNSLIHQKEWVDNEHFTPDASKRLVTTALGLEGVQQRLQQSSVPGEGRVPIVCVLSDGWHHTQWARFARSRYWRYRLDYARRSPLPY